jgi:hypothetical protein
VGNEPRASGSDLHRDKMDGGFEFGGCVTFFGAHERNAAQWRQFAIFETSTGGEGVSIKVLHEDWVCALCCRYNEHLHGTVFEPDSSDEQVDDVPGSACGIEGLHVVSFNLKMMESFVKQVSAESADEQRSVVELYLDERMRRIAMREGAYGASCAV